LVLSVTLPSAELEIVTVNSSSLVNYKAKQEEKMKKLKLVLILIMLTSISRGQNISNTIELNSNWEYTHFPYCQTDEQALAKSDSGVWKTAVVPGDVHLDLQRNGILPDLYFGQNFYSSIWVENEDFVYRTKFDKPLDTYDSKIYLDFDGLDCFATIWLNNKMIGKTHNMFKTYSFDITNLIKDENNDLMVRLAAPMKEVYKQVPNARSVMDTLSGAFNVKERLITRKMQMSYGWDNVPRIITTGIYRPVKIRICKTAKIDNVWFRTKLEDNYSSATVNIAVDLVGNTLDYSKVEVTLSKNDNIYKDIQNIVFKDDSLVTTNFTIKISNPELWWPNGLGSQPLYNLKVKLYEGEKESDSYSEKVGIREIKVVTTPVEKRMVNYRIGNPDNKTDVMDGGFVGAWSKIPLKHPKEVEVTPFRFYINGRYVFIKGWNWQPLDVFLSSVSKERYLRSVMAAKEAGANMLRVWGGGNVENTAFYDACDELGIMVWQDFFYASGQYPNDNWFLKEIEGETVNIVKRLRNRACLAAWCGDNESDMGRYDRGKGQFSNSITHVVQKEVLAKYDPDRYWHPSSPSGGGYPRSPWGGDKRNWGAQYPFNDYVHIRGDEARFISEGGAPSIAQLSSFRKYMPQQFEWPVNSDYYYMHWGDVPTMRRNFPENVMGNITKYFGKPKNISEFIFLSQIFQAHGQSRMALNFRKNRDECGGVLMWKWADTWPSVSLSVIDYDENKKAAWYSAKRDFAPTALMIDNKNDNLSVWYLNDLQVLNDQNVTCQLKKCDGSLIKEWTGQFDFEENSSKKVIDLKLKREEYNNGEYYLKVWVTNNNEIQPYYFPLSDLVDLKTIPGDITINVKRKNSTTAIATFKAVEFTPYVWITGNNPYIQLSDNSFYLEKGEEREIEIFVPEGELWGDFSYTWWKGETRNFLIGSELLKPVEKK